MDKETYKLTEALRRAGFSEAKIQAFLKDFEAQLHERVVKKLVNDGHSLEEAEILYQKAKSIIEEEDQELLLKLIRDDKKDSKPATRKNKKAKK